MQNEQEDVIAAPRNGPLAFDRTRAFIELTEIVESPTDTGVRYFVPGKTLSVRPHGDGLAVSIGSDRVVLDRQQHLDLLNWLAALRT